LKTNFSHSRSGRPRHRARVQFHGSTPFGNTTIFIGGHPPNPLNPRYHQNNDPDMGTVFQTVLAQLVGGGGSQQYPL